MVRRRARQTGIENNVSPHSMRATGITSFLENGGELEAAQRIAQGEIERIRFD